MNAAGPRVAEVMRGFWDEKARENPLWYVSSYRRYGEEDAEEFWRWGTILADRHLGACGVAFTGREAVLEIGCGIGRMTRPLAARFARVTAIDVSAEMATLARENLADCANADVRLGSGVDLGEFPDASFDLVFSYLVFQHIPDAAVTYGYVREMGRVLRANGHAVFQVNNGPGSRPWSGLARRLRGAVSARPRHAAGGDDGPRGLDHPAWVGSRVSVDGVAAACRDGGLAITRLDGRGTQYMWVTARKEDR